MSQNNINNKESNKREASSTSTELNTSMNNHHTQEAYNTTSLWNTSNDSSTQSSLSSQLNSVPTSCDFPSRAALTMDRNYIDGTNLPIYTMLPMQHSPMIGYPWNRNNNIPSMSSSSPILSNGPFFWIGDTSTSPTTVKSTKNSSVVEQSYNSETNAEEGVSMSQQRQQPSTTSSCAPVQNNNKHDRQKRQFVVPSSTSCGNFPIRVGGTRVYIGTIQEFDVLCGRGAKSNHNPGNKRYRQVVKEMKAMYQNCATKSDKTKLSRCIVDHVHNYGGRFIKKEEGTDRYYLLSQEEARRKTSQALRESKDIKWTT